MNNYSLYVMRCTQETIAVAEKERFSRITPEYVLVLAKLRPATVKSVEIPKDSLRKLSRNDKVWIKDCFVVLTAEELKAKEADIVESLSDKISKLETALQEEQNKLERNEKDV